MRPVPGGHRFTTGGRLVGALLRSPCRFAREWLDEGPKTVVPVPISPPALPGVVARVAAGAREAGAGHLLAARTGDEHAGDAVVELPVTGDRSPPEPPWEDAGLVLALPGLAGAALLTEKGYGLIAGQDRFVRACLEEGIDEARARFGRYARRLAASHPGLAAVAEEFPPRLSAVSSPAEAVPASAIGRQLDLMRSLACGDLDAAGFAPAWLAARRRALTAGERARGTVERALDDVFFALEDYAADPALREPGDLTDDELKALVRAVLGRLGDSPRSTPAPRPPVAGPDPEQGR
ncbi:hypothetical protein [Sphaerisporangium dianthi]|uniref:Colicin D immunity protein domain-containing protein n=1 Tax=Sphaerisporangium dianthi TaxID=1436120 RepID=A0ABV9CG47_9ACTN